MLYSKLALVLLIQSRVAEFKDIIERALIKSEVSSDDASEVPVIQLLEEYQMQGISMVLQIGFSYFGNSMKRKATRHINLF